MTEVRRINLASITDLESAIQNLCTNMATGGFNLITSFVYQNELVFIFQK